MSKTPAQYFTFIANAKSEARKVDRGALNSLDIIDTKAGGLAGLIGGFSAAAMVALQLGEPWVGGPGVDVALFGVSLTALAIAGWQCAASLGIISHHDAQLIDADLALPEDGDGVLEQLYAARVRSYRSAHGLFNLGAAALAGGTIAMLVELSL